MDVFNLYKLVCEGYANYGGGAVSASVLLYHSKLQRDKFYRCMSVLIKSGFVVRVKRGWYVPVNVYQWIMDDFDLKYKDVSYE